MSAWTSARDAVRQAIDEGWSVDELEGALLLDLPGEHGAALWLYAWSYNELRRPGQRARQPQTSSSRDGHGPLIAPCNHRSPLASHIQPPRKRPAMHETLSITATNPAATTAVADLDQSVTGLGAVNPLLASPASCLEDEEGAMIDRMILAALVAP